jgi:hypothetical protein
VRRFQRGDPRKALRRDLIVAAVVIVLGLGLGAVLAFAWGDATRMFNIVKMAFVDENQPLELDEIPQFKADAPVQGCRYCVVLNEVYRRFERRAAIAKTNVAALTLAISQSDDEAAKLRKRTELAEVKRVSARSSTAVAILKTYVNACAQEDFCRVPVPPPTQGACAQTEIDTAMRGPAMGLAAAAKDVALACAVNACPAIDCAQSDALREQLTSVSRSLAVLGGPGATSRNPVAPFDLPVGAAALGNELNRVLSEASYVARLFPLMLEPGGAQPANGAPVQAQLPTMAPEMISNQAGNLQALSAELAEASNVTPALIDMRREAAWRVKTLSLGLSEAGTLMAGLSEEGADEAAKWSALSSAWGSAMLSLGAVAALESRLKLEPPSPEGCDGALGSAAQSTRESAALLDMCRVRAACVSKRKGADHVALPIGATAAERAKKARELLAELIPRAQAGASLLSVTGGSAVASGNAAETGQTAAALGAEGVCRRDAASLAKPVKAASTEVQTLGQPSDK